MFPHSALHVFWDLNSGPYMLPLFSEPLTDTREVSFAELHTLAETVFLRLSFVAGSHYFADGALQLVGSRDPLASGSKAAETRRHFPKLKIYFPIIQEFKIRELPWDRSGLSSKFQPARTI